MAGREQFLAKAKSGVQKKLLSRDKLLIHCTRAIEDLQKSSNLVYERLMEWYGIYFPEFRADTKQFAQVIIYFDRKNVDEKQLASIIGDPLAKSVVAKAQRSMGVDLAEKDLAQIKSLANLLLAMLEQTETLENYRDVLAKEVAPNVTTLLDPAVTAKLISNVGGIDKLALLPASTIQVLGAEKALFRHLTDNTRPPKHGLIFQHPVINKAPKDQRGKIARILAAKVAIAAKADAFSHNFIADKLKEDFEKRLAQIREQGA